MVIMFLPIKELRGTQLTGTIIQLKELKILYSQQEGTKARDYSNESLNNGQRQKIQIGERGGHYYINSNGYY